jgi:hypothetical protein
VTVFKSQATHQPEKAKPLHQQAGYFQNNLKCMNYLKMHMEGHPIGRGVVERAVKQYKQRFCGPGMRWSCPGIERPIPVRTAILIKLFDKT